MNNKYMLMTRKEKRLPYDAPWMGCIRLDVAGGVCNNTSPNHAGDDIPWYPGDDDDNEL